jgi:hypothetical protein
MKKDMTETKGYKKYCKRIKKARKLLDKLNFDDQLALLDTIVMSMGTELVTEIVTNWEDVIDEN